MGNKKVGSSTREGSKSICVHEDSEIKPKETDLADEDKNGSDNETTVDASKNDRKDDQPSPGNEHTPNHENHSSTENSGNISAERPKNSVPDEPPVTVAQEEEAVDKTEGSQDGPIDGMQEHLQADDEEEDEGPWELKKILSMQDLNSSCPIKCSTDGCVLPAGVLYCSVSNKKCTYYYCLDCQENDFEGWPPLQEIPVKSLSKEHQELLVAKCSKYKDTAMPAFFESPVKATKLSKTTNTITPPPQSMQSPMPQPKENNGVPVISPADEGKKKAKPSKAHLEMHRKWQEAAESMGGPGARIVLSKPAAKKIVYDFLYDAFRPRTITQIYEGLKATIPSPVLKACLDDMTLDTDTDSQFAESDDEDEPKSKTKKASSKTPEDLQYKASLCMKTGRGSGSTLYFVDYNKAKNGDGFPHEQKSKIAEEVSTAEAELAFLQQEINSMNSATSTLLQQPKNPELAEQLAKEEKEMSTLKDALETARNLVVNEAHKNQVKRRIENFSTIWRKRRNLCMNFLSSMESWTEGSVTAKKCFAENGTPFELESDESAAASAMEYAKNIARSKKRPRPGTEGIKPNANFVAVMLDKQGKRTRVFVDDDIHQTK